MKRISQCCNWSSSRRSPGRGGHWDLLPAFGFISCHTNPPSSLTQQPPPICPSHFCGTLQPFGVVSCGGFRCPEEPRRAAPHRCYRVPRAGPFKVRNLWRSWHNFIMRQVRGRRRRRRRPDQVKRLRHVIFCIPPPAPAFDLAKNSQFGSVAKVTRRCWQSVACNAADLYKSRS